MPDMQRLLLSLLLVFSLLATQANAQEVLGGDNDTFEHWANYYYLNRETGRVEDYLKHIQDSNLLSTAPKAAAPMAAFLSVVFAENPDRITFWIKEDRFTGETKAMLMEALWLSGHADKIMTIFHENSPLADQKPINLEAFSITDPVHIDMIWGAFSASGNEVFVNKIIDVLDETKPLSGDAAKDKAIREQARWSLQTNMLQHDVVEKAVRKAINTTPPAVAKDLKYLLTESLKNRISFSKHDGDFTAIVAITTEATTKAFNRVSALAVEGKELKKVKRGERIAINVLFSGMALDANQFADVSYDMKVTTPANEVYDQLAFGNMKIIKEKVHARYGLFSNKDVVLVRFEPKDKAGVYKVTALIKDNIGDKKIPITAKIELVD